MHKRFFVPGILAIATVVLPWPAAAQLITTGAVINGHHHFNVSDVDAHLRFWVDGLGGAQGSFGPNTMIKFPDALVLLRDQVPEGGMIDSTVNHVAFTVPDLRSMVDKLSAAGYEFVTERDAPASVDVVDDIAVLGGEGPISGFAYVMGPDDIKVEILEVRSQDRPIDSHHIHFYASDPIQVRDWYMGIFGAGEGPAPFPGWATATLPGLSLNISPTETVRAGTAGRALDHIGFEIENLEDFVAELAAKGIEFDVPYREIPEASLKLAYFTDPWGTYIELTEGLDLVR